MIKRILSKIAPTAIISKSAYFDCEKYSKEYNIEMAKCADDYYHNWEKHKLPSDAFDQEYYLEKYPDIKMNPLLHYEAYGKKEQRKIKRPASAGMIIRNRILASRKEIAIRYVNPLYESISFDGFCCIEKGAELSEGIEYFKDDCLTAVFRLDSRIIKQGIYSFNELLNRIDNIDDFVISRNDCAFKTSKEIEYNSDDFKSDYSFTTFIIRQCAGSFVYVLSGDAKREDKEITDIERMQRFAYVIQNYKLSDEALNKYYEQIIDNADITRKSAIRKTLSAFKTPKKRTIISIYSFTNGGGEIAPIRLANSLKERDYPVLVHILKEDLCLERIKDQLYHNIPVIYTEYEDEFLAYVMEAGIECINTHHLSNQYLVSKIYDESLTHIATSHGMLNAMSDDDVRLCLKQHLKGKVDTWTYVADNNLLPFEKAGENRTDYLVKIPNGIKDRKKREKVDLCKYGITDECIKVCIASRSIPEKGWLEAIKAVGEARSLSGKDLRLILVGDGPIYEQIKDEHEDYVYPVGLQNNVISWYLAADICMYPTYYEGESAPLSIIEMLQAEKPIIASDIGEIRNMLKYGDDYAGIIVDLVDGKVEAQSLCQKLLFLVNNPDIMDRYAKIAALHKKDFDIRIIADKYVASYNRKESPYQYLLRSFIKRKSMVYASEYDKEQCPLVSVIVPNYNYRELLKRRLDCIYHQTYRNIEVILLDDCSTDNSQEILASYHDQYAEITRLFINKENHGVFPQWKKGIENARGELCWIAEADDWCEDDFLEKLVPKFLDPDVRIAYGKYVFAKNEKEYDINSYQNHVSTIDSHRWHKDYLVSAEEEVNTALGRMNTLANVSGLIFRKPADCNAIFDDKLLSMKICGDWLFYLRLLRGGKISYCSNARSYFRMMDAKTSASHSTYGKPIYYQEHEIIARFIKEYYEVDDSVLSDFYLNLKRHKKRLKMMKRNKVSL